MADITELIFILDRSGSMGGLESDTIGGFNAMLIKQQAEPGEAYITTVLFDDKYEVLHNHLNIHAVSPLTPSDYYVRGSTALLDAVGKAIHGTIDTQKSTSPAYRSDKVLFVITTDGLENASREFNYNQVKRLIEQQKEKYKWEFLFMGANMDSEKYARSIGIDADHAQNYRADGQGTQVLFDATSSVISGLRSADEANVTLAMPQYLHKWKSRINKDYEKTDR